MSDEERRLLTHYNLDFAIIDSRFNWSLFRWAVLLALVLVVPLFFLFAYYTNRQTGAVIAVLTSLFCGWYLYDWYRLEIWVRDLLVGRTFRSFSIWRLVQQEEYLRQMAAALEQTVQAAKNWGADDLTEIPKVDAELLRTVIAKRFR